MGTWEAHSTGLNRGSDVILIHKRNSTGTSITSLPMQKSNKCSSKKAPGGKNAISRTRSHNYFVRSQGSDAVTVIVKVICSLVPLIQ